MDQLHGSDRPEVFEYEGREAVIVAAHRDLAGSNGSHVVQSRAAIRDILAFLQSSEDTLIVRYGAHGVETTYRIVFTGGKSKTGEEEQP